MACIIIFVILNLSFQHLGYPYFPRQPDLPNSVFLSIVETEDDKWEMSQLLKDFMALKTHNSLNNSLSVKKISEIEDFLDNQRHYKYFEGDIIGWDAVWAASSKV